MPEVDDDWGVVLDDDIADVMPAKPPIITPVLKPVSRKVSLTDHEWMNAAMTAIFTTIQNKRRGATDKDGLSADRRWDSTIEGFCGEAALAKFMDCWWSGNLGDYSAVDVGGKYQAKTTGTDYLILRRRDPDSGTYVCLKGRAPEYEVVGWMSGKEGKNPKYWGDVCNNGRPAYFIPLTELRPIESLLKGAGK